MKKTTTIGLLTPALAALAGAQHVAANHSVLTIQVNTTQDTPDVNPGDGICADAMGNCSLRAAIQEANASGMPTRIRLAPGQHYNLQIAGSGEDAAASGDLDVHGDVRLRGRNATIDAQGLDRIFDVSAGGHLRLHRVHLMGGSVQGESGGAVRSAGTLRVVRSTISASSATGAGASGGALFNDAGTLRVLRSTLTGCDAERAGGAIEANAGYTLVRDSSMDHNMAGAAPGNGGAFHLTGAGVVDIEHCQVTQNTASREGGGLWNSASGEMNVFASHIAENTALGMAADDGGGGLFNDGGVLHVEACTIDANQASMGSGSGGGLFNLGGEMVLRYCSVTGNVSQRAGGGIEAVAGVTSVWHSDLIENSTGHVPGNGGGLHLTGAGEVDVYRANVRDNQASAEGGGLWNSAVGHMAIEASDFRGNAAHGDAADQGGGALFNDGGTMVVMRSSMTGNVADGASGSGGAIFNHLGDLSVQRCTMAFNQSNRAGGAVEAKEGNTNLERVFLRSNSTGSSPGNGGGLHLTGAGNVSVDLAILLFNSASNEGGGLWNSSTGTMVATRTIALFNLSPDGPNVFNDGGSFTFNGANVPPAQ